MTPVARMPLTSPTTCVSDDPADTGDPAPAKLAASTASTASTASMMVSTS